MKKILLVCFAFVTFAGALSACGKSVETKCEELVKATSAPLGDIQKSHPKLFEQQVKICVASGGPR